MNGGGNCCNRQQFNSYENFQPWGTSNSNGGYQTSTFNTGSNPMNPAPVIQTFTVQPNFGTDNSFSFGYNSNSANYGTFSSLPKSNFENFNHFGTSNTQYGSASNRFGSSSPYINNIPNLIVTTNKQHKA